MGVVKRKIPYEITEYKGKFILGLTARQIICAVCMIALAVPTGLIGWKVFGLTSDTLGYIILVEVAPFAAAGWMQYNDMPIEVIGKKVIEFNIGQQRRKWKYKDNDVKAAEAVAKMQYEQLAADRKLEIIAEKKQKKRKGAKKRERK